MNRQFMYAKKLNHAQLFTQTTTVYTLSLFDYSAQI